MNDYTLLYPPTIRFAWGARAETARRLAELAGGTLPRTFLVCSRSVRQSGLVDSLIAELGKALVAEQLGVSHDPPIAEVDALAETARRTRAEAVLAIGGGSVMDAAKAAAGIAPSGLPCAEFYHRGHALPANALPVVALPTTAGTGAEITKNSVLSDPVADTKKSIRSPHIIPKVAIIDPELTVSMSPAVTAASGMDALTQAVESYLSLGAHATSQALAIAAVRLLMRWLPAAHADGQNQEARTRVAEGSMLSAMAFGQSGLGAVHGLAHPLGHLLDLAHGFTCAVLLPHVLRWNAPDRPAEMAELAQACGLADGPAFIGAIERMAASFGIPRGLAALDPTQHTEYVVANCRSGSMRANPRPMSDEDVLAMLHTLANP
jgi:alcohol dehydrogenase class IV